MEEKEVFEPRDSIEVSCTSKGVYSFKVKRYYDFGQDEPPLVIKSIKKIYDELKESFKEEGK